MAPLTTPDHCLADICLIPIGTGSASVSAEIANVTRLFRAAEADSNVDIKCTMHSAGTTIEGSWDSVLKLIGQAHTLLHEKGVVRVQSDIRIGTRTDKMQTAQDKVRVVEERLANETSTPHP